MHNHHFRSAIQLRRRGRRDADQSHPTPSTHRIGTAEINYARACSELVTAIAATATAKAANRTADLTETAVTLLNEIRHSLSQMEPPQGR